ncbi:ATP-dependent DNA helicase RecG [Gordonia otitidis]|uniref:Probable DNA 3'-5' helicase RecG n=1 Tax=Gordonia otitidis (strain DSM 44809 / CCUG 52243 / JCM 12355 / NBRC 100426 / IFM 10032) TaxID=1108044 RepID=H5TRV3_GORO1|nr:ATP-dependent DNA helicase RecG [Gordonia otitidis]GAB36211.1 ATP-dependent DNA helicase RecG [Gordonia otitidis NBRC 100426]
MQSVSRVQRAYLLHAARLLVRSGTTSRALSSAIDRSVGDWTEPLLQQVITDVHTHRRAAESCGVDFARIPPPPAAPRQPEPGTASWPTDDQDDRSDTITVPDGTQLRTSREILSDTTGQPIVFDGNLDSLRGVPIAELAGTVPPHTISRLEQAGVRDLYELLMRIPRTYIDRSSLTPLARLTPGTDAAFTGVVIGITTDRSKRIVRIRVADGPARITCTFFNALWMAKRFRDRDLVVVQGKVSEYQGVPQMRTPIIERLEEASSILVPVYPQSTIRDAATGKRDSELTTTMLRTATIAALQRLPSLDDPIPTELITRRRVMSRLDALRAVHIPDSAEHAVAGRARLAYDELLRLQLALGVIRNKQAANPGIVHRPTGALVDRWISTLPYTLTGAQQRAITEIRADLMNTAPSSRLILGDVGAGKTNCLIAAALDVIEGKHQVCLLAPTEILARQHFAEIADAFTQLDLRVDLLVSKAPPRPRRHVLQSLAAGTTHLVVGTHSILSEQVEFASLGLAMIDEQHRFGVDQRAQLLAKGPDGRVPDILQATATPIPRTSAITTYGDMAVTILDEKPAGREDIHTEWIADAAFDDPDSPPWQAIRADIAAGRQAFVVCSRVESTGNQSETQDAAAATEAADELAGGVLHGLRIAVAHGKQKPDERQHVMDEFTAGRIDVLVATTVIEVGVSVPNATIMVVLNANKFGLAQLHQIRGRVGRGRHRGCCWLVSDSSNDDAIARMTAMTSTNDGFALAEMDLKIRGAGALTGTEQSGHDAGLRVADLLGDARIHLAAREDARRILAHDPQLLRHLTLKREVDLALGDNAHYLTRG